MDMSVFFLSIAALGVVYGDISTSPLYTVNEIFFGRGGQILSPQVIYGCIGLVIWTITLVVAVKYVLIVLQADHDGEGGVFALASLISKAKIKSKRLLLLSGVLLVFAAGLLLGDGIITPAISVVSAVEGLRIATPAFAPYIVPIAIAVLTVFFLIQKSGTATIGRIFGPIIILWLAAMGFFGTKAVLANPEILNALNPAYILAFLSQATPHQILTVLGSVMLAVTGGEALYADLGHFGKKPIRITWFSLVYPMLILNYLGQGAYLLSGRIILHDNIFFSMVPGWAVLGMVVLGTAAAIIASQALISGAFSLISQAIALQLFPRMRIIHTHHAHEGQIYIPGINWLLYLGSVTLVLVFRTSTNMASAYGLAVSGVMLITTMAIFVVAASYWKWGFIKVTIILLPFFIIDLMFFGANLLKLFEGGYIPLAVAVVLFAVMKVWEWGRKHIRHAIESYHTITMQELVHRKINNSTYLPRSVIIMTPKAVTGIADHIPALEQLFIERYGLLPKNILFLTVVQHRVPYMKKDRYHITHFYKDHEKGQIASVMMNFGFMEEPNVEKYLLGLARHHLIAIPEHPKTWLIHVLEDHFSPGKSLNPLKTIAVRMYGLFEKNSIPIGEYFGLGNVSGLSSEFLPVKISS